MPKKFIIFFKKNDSLGVAFRTKTDKSLRSPFLPSLRISTAYRHVSTRARTSLSFPRGGAPPYKSPPLKLEKPPGETAWGGKKICNPPQSSPTARHVSRNAWRVRAHPRPPQPPAGGIYRPDPRPPPSLPRSDTCPGPAVRPRVSRLGSPRATWTIRKRGGYAPGACTLGLPPPFGLSKSDRDPAIGMRLVVHPEGRFRGVWAAAWTAVGLRSDRTVAIGGYGSIGVALN
ncbi:hypothetical protein NL676_029023 [Syzygium grande]|nr:hypothetical protein NL676_029023 [Syzygium grande]